MSGLCATLEESQWSQPSLCPGWSCKDALIHVTAAEMGFADWTPSPNPPMAEIVEFARSLRSRSGADVLQAFDTITARRGEQLANLSEADFDVPGWSPAGVGPYRRYMEIRVFDHWAHEQDLRVPLGIVGHLQGRGATISLDEAHRAFGYLVGKRAGVPDGASVSVHVRGSVVRDLHAVVEGRARVVDDLDQPTCEVTVEFLTFMLLCCGRIDPDDALRNGQIELAGDVALAEQVARNLAFTI